ncbi:hypothetical protein M0R45_029299 [Rubus argutus]|uniref:PGG domain-containing protein n=1 Tax=Rubus argutus TaxID=59490 RepID=A0AAW1W844_RUBAR
MTPPTLSANRELKQTVSDIKHEVNTPDDQKKLPPGYSPGEANIAPKAEFVVFFIFDSFALFISLAVVVVQTSLVVIERKQKEKLMTVINKLMWMRLEASKLRSSIRRSSMSTRSHSQSGSFSVMSDSELINTEFKKKKVYAIDTAHIIT